MKSLAEQLARRYGLHFAGHNVDLLERGLRRLAETMGLSDDALCSRLGDRSANTELWQRAIEFFTVGETYLFRHPEQLMLLWQRLIPERLATGQRHLRAWSAGCATGEEAYSLAMVLRHAAPQSEIYVLATDVSPASIATAERGKYGTNSLREPIPPRLASAYLHPTTDGGVEVSQEIRSLIEFRQVNLVNSDDLATVPGEFDFIFCRNVLIYFTPEHNRDVLSMMRNRLSDGGYLVLSALDQREKVPGLELQVPHGVPVLKRVDPPRPSASPQPSRRENSQLRDLPALPTPPPRLLLSAIADDTQERTAEVKAAADQGDLQRAAQLARRLLQSDRTPQTLQLLAMILGEQGKYSEAEQLLLEALTHNPDDVLAHLRLGLLERPQHQKWRGTQHLRTVMMLLAQRPDDEVLNGPEPLQVAMARRLATAGLANMERRS